MKNRFPVHLTTGDFDAGKYPCPPALIVPSADECRHTPTPELYHQWYEWCERASKTHSSIKCPHCGLWSIWLPKAMAKEINKRDRAEELAVAKMVKRQIAKENRARAKAMGSPYPS